MTEISFFWKFLAWIDSGCGLRTFARENLRPSSLDDDFSCAASKR